VTCYIAVLVPTAMRNDLVAEAELAIEQYVLSTGLLDVSSPATFWTWLHDKWLPELHEHRRSFPPSGVKIYDAFQRPVVGAYGNSYIARPRPLEDPYAENSTAAFWGVGMVLRQHRVRMANCSAVQAGVDRFTPASMMVPGATRQPGAGECYEKVQLSSSDSWKLTQYTTTVRSQFTIGDCAKGCSGFGGGGCSAFVVSDGDGFLTAQYTDAGISGATLLNTHPRLATSKTIEAARSWREAPCFMAAAQESQALDCNGSVVDDEASVPPRGQTCVTGIKMTAFRPAACPVGAQLCAPPYSDADKDTTGERWGGREGFGFRAGGGGWNRRRESAAAEAENERDAASIRALYGSSGQVTSNSTDGANSSAGGAGGLDVARYGDPWVFTQGPGRLWGGPWSGTGGVVGRMGVYPGGGYGVDLLQEGGVAGIARHLQESAWIDRASRAVSIDMWVMQPLAGHVTRATILFELAPGGRWLPSLSMRSGPLAAASLHAAAAADAALAARPAMGVRAGKIARGVGDWLGMEVVMMVLQVLPCLSCAPAVALVRACRRFGARA